MLFPIILSRKSTKSFVTSNLSKQMFQPKTASFHQSSLPPCALFSEKATCPEVQKGSPLKFIMVGSWGQKIRLRGQIPPPKKLTWEWENSPFRCISYWTMDNFPMSIFSFKGRKKNTFQGEKKPCRDLLTNSLVAHTTTRRIDDFLRTKLRVHKKHRRLKSLCRRLEHASLGLPGQSFNGRVGGRKENLGTF